jgi:Flp pilus assembly protein TadG
MTDQRLSHVSPLKRMGQAIQRLRKNRRGASAVVMTAALIPTLGATGSAVDLARAHMAKSQLQAAVDAAALAGAKEFFAANRDTLIRNYFISNFPRGQLGTAQDLASTLTIDARRLVNNNRSTILVDVEVAAQVPTVFMRLFGFSNLTVRADAQAKSGETEVGRTTALEVMLALDNTGSMASTDMENGTSRIQALRSAATSFVDIVYNGETSSPNLSVGIVPFTVMANTGRLVDPNAVNLRYPGTTTELDYVSRTDGWRWGGCLAEDGWLNGASRTVQALNADSSVLDANAWDIRLDNPVTTAAPKWDPFLSPPQLIRAFGAEIWNNYHIPNAGGSTNWHLATASNTSGHEWHKAAIRAYQARYTTATTARTPRGLALTNVSGDINLNALGETTDRGASWRTYLNNDGTVNTAGWPAARAYSSTTLNGPSPNFHCPAQALPPAWGVTATTLKDYIRDQNHAYNPGLGTFTHTGFVWAWRMLQAKPLFPGLVPNPNGLPTRQVLVLMTDGFTDSSDDGNDWPRANGNRNGAMDTNFTVYGRYSDALMGTDRTTALAGADLRLAKACQAAKAGGVQVYVISLKANAEVYRRCASSDQQYFVANNSSQLTEAFRAIALDLVDLHLSE